jgi:hypothetical protein
MVITMSNRKPIRVPARYEDFIVSLEREPFVKIKEPAVVTALSRRLAPIGTFYRNGKRHESVFIRDCPFFVSRKTTNSLFLDTI